MKKIFSRVVAMFLAVFTALTMLPTQVYALEGGLSEKRGTNTVYFPGMKFYERFTISNVGGWYEVPFDKASHRVMFCVDPNKGASTDPSKYTVTIANNANITALIKQAQTNSKLKYATLKDNTDWDKVIGADVLETLDSTALDRIIQLMSVLHLHWNDGYYGHGQYNTSYNAYAVYAVQNYVWYICDPQTKGMWWKLEQGLTASEMQKVKNVYYQMLKDIASLYGGGTVSKFRLDSGNSTKTTAEAALKSAIQVDSSKTFGLNNAADAENFAKIKFIAIDGGSVQNFTTGSTASAGGFSITNNGDGISVECPESEKHTVQFLTTSTVPNGSTTQYSTEDWAIYAQSNNNKQSFFSAYKAPKTASMFMGFKNIRIDSVIPYFPGFEFLQHKYDRMGGYDADTCTPVGDTKLDATFTLDYETDLGASGSVSSTADLYGHGASEKIEPWGRDSDPDTVVTKRVETSTYSDGDDEIEYESDYYWDGTCTVTVSESEAPEGHWDTDTTYTHTIVYHAESHRGGPDEPWSAPTYKITVDGKDTGLTTSDAVKATWDSPLASPTGEDDFINKEWVGILQIIKEIGSDDIFSEEDGKGTVAGGVTDKKYSTDSKWTIRIIDKSVYDPSISADEAAKKFEGYENCPYIKVVEDSQMQSSTVGRLMHCYKVMLDGTGTPADENNPLTPSQFGQIFVDNIPYGTYLVTEIKADGDRYVKESMYFTISEDQQVISTDIVNDDKENVVKIVKVDSETGKTVPSPDTAFRIRYMGSPEYADPTKTPNYGRYLPNASNIYANVTHAEDYIFYTDTAGEVTIPYALPYGNYQLEEILVPDGYYIGKYDEDGVADSAGGKADSYGENDDNHQTTGPSMAFTDRVAIYDKNGNHVDYTKDENVVYNYYTFAVTEQNDHVDGDDYQTYYLTVEIQNTAAKGSVEISKLGERLVGFKESTDEHGNTVSTPVYESFPLEGAKFGIYSAEDVLLEDGEESPKAYDKKTDEEIELVTDVLNHIQFPNAQIIQSGTHKESGAEVIYTKQRDKSENNIATVEYLTPAQKGTKYNVKFSRYDADAKLTYDYDVEFGLEYTAGGWNYTDIHVKRTLTSDDYTPTIADELPKLFNGNTEVSFNSAVFANKNKLEMNSELKNEYNLEANKYEILSFSVNADSITPEFADGNGLNSIENMPEIPAGYSLLQLANNQITIVNDTDVNDILVATKKVQTNPDTNLEEVVFDKWVSVTDSDNTDYLVPHFKADDIQNMPELPAGVTFKYATHSFIYVDDHGTEKVAYTDANGNVCFFKEDRSDVGNNIPNNIPEGYVCDPSAGPIIAIKTNDDGTKQYKVYVLDTETNQKRWIDCDEDAVSYKQRVQEFDVTLTQHNTSTDGWRFEMDGLVLANKATNEDTATATITLPYNVEPTISDTVGSEITTTPLNPVGTETTFVVKHPTAPVYFNMIDNTKVEMVYLGGHTKTTLTVPAENHLPEIFYKGKKVDYFDEANLGLTPDKNKNEVVFDEYNYVRVTRHEADITHSDTYYTIEIVSSATTEEDAFLVNYHGSYESVSVVVPDAVTGAQRGNLQFRSIYKTMRYPLSDLVEEITTDERGIATSSLLPLGEYVIRELDAPDGFVASNATYPFKLEYKDQFTPLIWASAEVDNGAVSVQLDITKGFQKALNSTEYEAKAGAVFGVYAYNAITAQATATDGNAVTTTTIPAGTLVATVTTDENGKAVESIKLPKGDYYVQEISTLDGFELNDTKFIFRADDSVKSGNLEFSYEANGIYGKISHTGYKTADIEVTTYTQIPALHMTVNDIRYDLTEALDEKTVGNNVLVRNVVDADRSTFRITGTVDKPVTVQFDNGSKMIVTIDESGYKAQFIDGDVPVVVNDDSNASITEISSEQGHTYEFDPLVAFTGYTAETSTIYTAPQTKLTATNGTSLEFAYDLTEGVKKAIISYPSTYRYYTNEELPTKDVTYSRGDMNMDGNVNADDRTILNDFLTNNAVITDNQRLIADVNKDGVVNADDLTALDAVIAGTQNKESIVVKEKYLPNDAIKFETEGLGNLAYVGTVVDRDKRTVTVDLSKLTEAKTVTVGDAVATLNGDVIKLDGGNISAINTATGKTVTDGYMPDALYLSNGNTLTSGNRSIALSSTNSTAEAFLNINYDHRFMDMKVTNGTLSTAWVNGEVVDNNTVTSADGVRLAAGQSASLVFADNSIYHIELSNTGYIKMSVEGIVNGNIDYKNNIPTLKVNDSVNNFMDANRETIVQTVPMDKTSLDEIRQYNVKNITLARNDAFVKQLQVKINATGNIEDKTEGGRDDNNVPSDTTTEPVKNDLRPWISKVDATTGKELPGAKIEIYDSNNNTIASGTSDSNGKFYFNKPQPGTYTFKEVSAPSGYQLNTEIFQFTVHPDGTITGDNTIKDYPIPNTPSGGGGGGHENPKMTISKVDVTTGKGIPGATIEVLNETKDKVIASGKSDSNGKFTFNRPSDGKYWFHETVAPNGYVLNEEMFTFTVKNGKITGDDTITNEHPSISKVDATDAKGVPGATIEILNEDKTKVIASGVTDANGKFYFDRPAEGKYWFHETVAPNGYILNEEMFTFTVDKNGAIHGDNTITDERNKVIISKLDVTTSEGVPGATIEVMDEAGNIIASGITDANGYFGFYRPNPGKYYFHETVAPNGYLINEELFSFEVTEDLDIIGDCTITDVPNTIVIQKIEAGTGRPLQGATVELYDANGNLIQTSVSDENGNIYFTVPNIGTYTYRETISPEGYALDDSIHSITLNADGTITGDTQLTNAPYIPRTGLVDWTHIMFVFAGGLGAMFLALAFIDMMNKQHRTTNK